MHIMGKNGQFAGNSVFPSVPKQPRSASKWPLLRYIAHVARTGPAEHICLRIAGQYRGYYSAGMTHGPDSSKSSKWQERRRSPRLSLQVPIFVRGLDPLGEEFLDLTKTMDISGVGACLASPRSLHPDQLVSLRIPAPSPSSSGLVPEASPPISARVIRERPVGDIHYVGVEFVKPLG